MAIINLAGNFQPTSSNNGRNLPSSSERAPSTSNGIDTRPELTKSKAATSTQPTDVSQANIVSSQRKDENKEQVKTQIEQLQQFNQSIDRSLQFKVDEELGVTIVRVIDKDTDELIRQFPPEELLNLSRRLKELNDQNTGNSGVLLQEKV